MRMIKDDSFQTVLIMRTITGHSDEDGNWVPGEEKSVATALADIQPKRGQQRANELQTEYESDYVMFVGSTDIAFKDGFSKIKQGDIVIDESGQKYEVVFPGNWKSHYEIDIKAIKRSDQHGN